jgi:enoyl-CoA hydratase/carnithine racemase
VSEICESEDLQDRSLQIATIIAQNAPLSVVAAKKAIRRCIESSMVEGYVLERKLFNELAVTEDRQEGRLAFRERRLPVFKGK